MGGSNEIGGTVRNGIHFSNLARCSSPGISGAPPTLGFSVFTRKASTYAIRSRHGLPGDCVSAASAGLRRLVTVDAAVPLRAEVAWSTCPHAPATP